MILFFGFRKQANVKYTLGYRETLFWPCFHCNCGGWKAGIRIGVVANWVERANCCGIAIAASRRLIDRPI